MSKAYRYQKNKWTYWSVGDPSVSIPDRIDNYVREALAEDVSFFDMAGEIALLAYRMFNDAMHYLVPVNYHCRMTSVGSKDEFHCTIDIEDIGVILLCSYNGKVTHQNMYVSDFKMLEDECATI